jgi:UDP-4-amino-4,6-dideoxy-N-acetyl-beta-L-altrosamine transaminase
MTPRQFLPYGRQEIDADDVAAVTATLRSDYLTTGPAVDAFEAAFAERTGAKHTVACSSGTAGLHLAALALDLGPNGGAIVPTMTFLATANAIRFVGGEVAFADVSSDTGLMRPEDMIAALDRPHGAEARAVFPVHLNGQTADMLEIARLARARDLAIVEDACHALGTTYVDGETQVPVGACRHSDMAVFSFHPVKTITTAEGGIVTTNDDTLFGKLKLLRNHGMTRDPESFRHAELAYDDNGDANPWYYEMHAPSPNYRASDIHCALGLSQLAKLDRYAQKRRHISERYDSVLEPLAPEVRPLVRVPNCDPVLHLYVVLIDFEHLGVTRAKVMRRLADRGIGTQVHYLPVSHQPYYRERYGRIEAPGADRYYARCLTLPLFPSMQDAEVDHVVSELASVLGLAKI